MAHDPTTQPHRPSTGTDHSLRSSFEASEADSAIKRTQSTKKLLVSSTEELLWAHANGR